MKRKPFTASEVLHCWLETQIGSCDQLLPKGFERSSSNGALADTRARAAQLVSSFPLYSLCRPLLIEWCQGGLKEPSLADIFIFELQNHLHQFPFYSTTAKEMEDESRLPVLWLSVEDAASRIGLSKDCLRVRLDRLKTSLPFGTYKYERRWHVHPNDLEALR
jgi:hypothetical protein